MKEETKLKIVTFCMDVIEVFMDDDLKALARAESSTDMVFLERYCELDEGFAEWAEDVFGEGGQNE